MGLMQTILLGFWMQTIPSSRHVRACVQREAQTHTRVERVMTSSGLIWSESTRYTCASKIELAGGEWCIFALSSKKTTPVSRGLKMGYRVSVGPCIEPNSSREPQRET